MIENFEKYIKNPVISYRLNTFYSDIIMDKVHLIKRVEEILKLPFIKVKHKICILNPDETVAHQIPYEDVVGGSISYSENLQNGTRRDLSFTLINTSGKYTPILNSSRGTVVKNYFDQSTVSSIKKNASFTQHPLWACTKFSYDIGIAVSNDEYIWFNKGVFILDKATASQEDSRKEVKIQSKDKYSRFEGKTGKLLTAMEIPAGSDFIQVVKDLLTQSLGHGYNFDIKPPIFSPFFIGQKTPVSIKKEAGDTISSIFEELGTQMEAEFYYNEQGYFCWDKINEIMLDSHKPVCWVYEKKNGDLLNVSEDFNYEDAVNMIKVVGNNIDEKIYQALAVNDDPRSPFRVSEIGNRLGDIITDANVWSDLMALDLARYHLRKNNLACLKTSVSAKINPLIKLNQLIQINHSFFNLSHEKFVVNSISFSDNSYEMSIGVSNISNLTFNEAGDEGYVY